VTIHYPIFTAEISANGQMFAFGGDSAAFTSLAGISYPVGS